MGERIAPGLRTLLRERKITKSRISRGMVQKELEASKKDLETARKSLNEGEHKWATVQAYYSIFHAARALLYSKGFREKTHRGLLAALRQFYPPEIPGSMLDDFREAMELRESADYGLVWSEESATNVLDTAEAFLDKAKTILRAGKRSILDLTGVLNSKEAAELRSKVGETRKRVKAGRVNWGKEAFPDAGEATFGE